MPSKKKTKNSISIRRITFVVLGAMIAVLIITITYLLVQKYVQVQNDRQLLQDQKTRLDAAYEDINAISKDLLTNFEPSEVSLSELKKECGESSTKYGRGIIDCRSTLYIQVLTNETLDELTKNEERLHNLINGEESFTDVKSPRAGTDYLAGNRFYGTTSNYMSSERTDCYFRLDIYDSKQYQSVFGDDIAPKNAIAISLSCHETTKEPIYRLRN